ncbi:MAG TPA: DUF551 domain-containing protein [Blastocatellia bacterium]|nr:DUF551 domain-containing protein [Blastocatellia bacterium]
MNWKRAHDQLPPQDATVLIVFHRGPEPEVRLAIYKDMREGTPWFVYGHHQDWYPSELVSHWMPLPDLPE